MPEPQWDKQMPRAAENAVILLWIEIGLNTIAIVIDKLLEKADTYLFASLIVQMGIMTMFPYKINKGSNAARWIYIVLVIIGWILVIGKEIDIKTLPPFTTAATLLTIPIDIGIIYFLLKKENAAWFKPN